MKVRKFHFLFVVLQEKFLKKPSETVMGVTRNLSKYFQSNFKNEKDFHLLLDILQKHANKVVLGKKPKKYLQFPIHGALIEETNASSEIMSCSSEVDDIIERITQYSARIFDIDHKRVANEILTALLLLCHEKEMKILLATEDNGILDRLITFFEPLSNEIPCILRLFNLLERSVDTGPSEKMRDKLFLLWFKFNEKLFYTYSGFTDTRAEAEKNSLNFEFFSNLTRKEILDSFEDSMSAVGATLMLFYKMLGTEGFAFKMFEFENGKGFSSFEFFSFPAFSYLFFTLKIAMMLFFEFFFKYFRDCEQIMSLCVVLLFTIAQKLPTFRFVRPDLYKLAVRIFRENEVEMKDLQKNMHENALGGLVTMLIGIIIELGRNHDDS